MKIMLDPVLTAKPSHCSTNIQFYTFVNWMLERRDDVFFYWLVPNWVEAEEMGWYPDHPNIKYIRVPQHKDRTKEYVTLRDEMDKLIAFNGTHWDFDVLITVRAGLTPLMKMLINSPRQAGNPWVKEVWVIENMPLMKFKGSVLVLDQKVQDLYTLAGYHAADRVFLMSYHERKGIIAAARNYFTPSMVKGLQAKLKEVVPVQFDEFKKKAKKFWYKPGQEKPFCIAYVGRLASTGTNLDKVYRAMTNNWIMKGGEKVRLVVATVSTGGRMQPPPFVELIRAPREEFWRMAREDMHVVIIMHEEAGFLLAMIEPLMLGTPVIVKDLPWTRGQLGDDYPFYANSDVKAYALCKMFYDDYDKMYDLFKEWYDGWFVPTYTERFKTDHLYTLLENAVVDYEERLVAKIREKWVSRKKNDIVGKLIEYTGGEIHLIEDLRMLEQKKVLETLGNKLDEDVRDRVNLVFSPSFNDYRLILKGFFDYKDSSTALGHLKNE